MLTRLADDGVFVTQASSPFFAPKVISCIKQTLEYTGLTASAYVSNIPSFGPWGFVLASKKAIAVDRLSLPIATRYLTTSMLHSLFDLPKDLTIQEVEINRLAHPVIVRYQSEIAVGYIIRSFRGIKVMNLYILLIVVAGFALLLMQQQGALPFSKNKQKLPPVEKNLFNLDIGDIVQHEDVDWFVEGKLIYNTGSYNWFEYLLRDDDNILWLSIEEDDFVEVSLLREADIPEIESLFAEEQQKLLSQTDSPQLNSDRLKTIAYQQTSYRLSDFGTASINRLGNTLNREAQKCKYFDYKAAGDRRLSVEIWGGEIEVTIGNKINPRMLNFLPGDGRKVYG